MPRMIHGGTGSPPGTSLIMCMNCSASVGGWSEEVALAEWNRRASSGTPREADSERLDWLEQQSWIAIEKTDESDNSGQGENSAVCLRSTNPDGREFPSLLTATFREAINAARAPSPTGT